MALLCWLLLLESWPVAYAQQVLDGLHTYDIVRCEVVAEVGRDAVDVRCRLVLRVERPGPLRFLLTPEIEGLVATRGGREVGAELQSIEGLLRAVAPRVRGVPGILTVDAPAGREDDLELRYRWRPSGAAFAYAAGGGAQTHLSSFWLPTMADELFDVDLTVLAAGEAAGPGRREAVAGGWRFRTERPVPIVAFTSGAFRVASRGRLSVLLPPGAEADGEALLDDLAAVLATLEGWFGPGPDEFRLVVEPRLAPAPSYCGGGFAVVHRRFLNAPREAWIRHLAHECSHVWWGYRAATPVVGAGGTWLREGLAQWSGAEVAGALLGDDVRRRAFRSDLVGYVRRLDLRRAARDRGVLFANEPTLFDATYLDDPAIPYLRGGLVHRRLAEQVGADAFRSALRELAGAGGLVGVPAYARALGDAEAIAYYAGTTRLPDLALADVDPAARRAEVTCADPLWPGGRVAVRVETEAGARVVALEAPGAFGWEGEARRIEIDPERVHLDPIRSNNVWERR